MEDFNGGDISAWGPNSGAGLSVDVEIVASSGGKAAAKTVTAQVGCDGIALRDLASRELLKKFPYEQVAAWRHTADSFIIFAIPGGLSTQQVLDKEKLQQWKLKTPEGAALGQQCKMSMAELAKVQDNLDMFERTLTLGRTQTSNGSSSKRSGSWSQRSTTMTDISLNDSQ